MAEDKPAILKETTFTVEEGWAYRFARTGAIWMNKLFFSSLVLLGVWLLIAATSHTVACADSLQPVVAGNKTVDSQAVKCSSVLTPTSIYLGSMAMATFILSLAFGALGLIVGKRILEVAKADDEVGAQRPPEDKK